jgi:hypothetical protein
MQRAKEMARLFATIVLLLAAVTLWHRRASTAAAGYWLYLAILLCAPVAYPWYLLWVLCFVPLLNGPQGLAALVWAATAGTCYALWHLPTWEMPPRLLLTEYAPAYAVLLGELFLLMRSSRGAA